VRDAFAEQLTTIVGPANVLTDADTVASLETE
jgi:hypothetical protein